MVGQGDHEVMNFLRARSTKRVSSFSYFEIRKAFIPAGSPAFFSSVGGRWLAVCTVVAHSLTSLTGAVSEVGESRGRWRWKVVVGWLIGSKNFKARQRYPGSSIATTKLLGRWQET